MRVIVAALVISGLALASVPAVAQSKKVKCQSLCAARCKTSSSKEGCRSRCLPACEANHNK